MTKRMLTLTAALLCAGTTALAQSSGTPASAPKAPATVSAQPPEIKPFTVGDKAPELKVAKFVKGEPITGFEKGKTYVVEFWATWCGPCKESIPHLTELQKEYKDRVTFIGVSVWESDQAKVAPFVTEWGEKMEYTVAADEVPPLPAGTTAGSRQAQQFSYQNGSMSRTWMQAAGRDGIPSAFIVNADGRVAWIGDPRQMDESLEAVVSGKYDLTKAAATGKALAEFQKQFDAGQYTKAYDAVRGVIGDLDASALNEISWSIVDPDGDAEPKDLDLALAAATKGCEKTDWKDPAILDTLARVYFLKGDFKKAVEMQTKAVENAPAQAKPQLEAPLKEYKDALAKQGG